MNHIKALAIKVIATLLITYVLLGLVYNYSFVHALTLTLLLGVISYVLGDLLLLPRTGNLIATLSDFAMSMLLTWFYLSNVTTNDNRLFFVSIFTAIAVSFFEIFFHRYLKANILKDASSEFRINHNLQYQTETSEEIKPVIRNTKKDS